MTTADETFTDQECEVIFGICRGLANKDMAQEYKIPEVRVKRSMISIYDKANVCTRLELFEFVKAALNAELRRRRGGR